MRRLLLFGVTASRSRAIAVLLVLVALGGVLSTFSATADAASGGYGLIGGHIGPCRAKTLDKDPYEPFIVVLTRNGATFDSYNVSSDQGTASYHFDVPVGTYRLSTTWPRTKVSLITVKFGKTIFLNIRATCAPPNV
jgi:hypothetical protein